MASSTLEASTPAPARCLNDAPGQADNLAWSGLAMSYHWAGLSHLHTAKVALTVALFRLGRYPLLSTHSCFLGLHPVTK